MSEHINGAPPDESLPRGEVPVPRGVRTMAVVRWVLVALMALAAVSAVLYALDWLPGGGSSASATVYYCPMHPGIQQDHPGDCPICSMSLVPREGAASAPAPDPAGTSHAGHRHEPGDPYICPMHPEETGLDADARCPLCKMRLERRPEAGDGGPAEAHAPAEPVPGLVPVTLAEERVQLIGMRTARVTREPLVSQLRTVGFVTTNEKKMSRIQTRFSGWIEKLFVDETGQRVARGQVLAAVYSPELLTAQQEFLTALGWSTVRRAHPSHAEAIPGTLADDARKKLELLGISSEEIEELERARQPVRALKIRSPADGYVTEKNALPGLFVQPGTLLFEIADLSSVWLLAEVYEYEIGRVREGQPARLRLASYPGEDFSGRVGFLYPTLDTATRTLRARLEFKNPGLKLRPGMYGEVVIELDASEGLLIPGEAVVDTGEHQYVFVDRGGGLFEPRHVRVGARSDDKVQVVRGLAEGEVVVTTGNFLIDSESRLTATIHGSGDTGGTPAAPPGGHGAH